MQRVINSAVRGIDLGAWLRERGAKVVETGGVPDLDPSNRQTRFLGDHHESIRPLLTTIRRRANGKPHPTRLDFRGLPRDQVADIVRFGGEARRNGLFRRFWHSEAQRCARFEMQHDSRVVGFFTGGWFERYVLERVVRRLSDVGAGDQNTWLQNTKVVFPSFGDAEIDILVGMPNRVLWIECRSGENYGENLARYHMIGRTFFQLPPAHAALVVLDPLTPEERINLGVLSGMTVVDLAHLDQFLDQFAGYA